MQNQHGMIIDEGPQDWQVLQHTNGSATLPLAGTWSFLQAAIDVGIQSTQPMVRVMSEEDNYPVIPWQHADFTTNPDGISGSWRTTLALPAGGLYRIETGLETQSTTPGLGWIFRGDVRFHIGVGDVFVIAGQSNATGSGRDPGYDPPDMRVHLFRNRKCWDMAAHPFGECTGAAGEANYEPGVSGTSPYLSFGKRFSAITGWPVGLVTTSMGGQPISRWDSRLDGSLLQCMLERIQACGSEPAGVLWYQGCADSNPDNAEKYAEAFDYFVTDFRQKLGYQIPFFTFQLNREYAGDDPWYGIVREAQRTAPQRLPALHVLPTLDCNICDGVHNGSHSNLRLGERLARQCAGVLRGEKPHNAPNICAARCNGRQMEIQFENLVGNLTLKTTDLRFNGFTVEDAEGAVEFEEIHTERKPEDTLFITLKRPLKGGAWVSYAWEAAPTEALPLDNVTFLPPLAFYRYPVKQVT